MTLFIVLAILFLISPIGWIVFIPIVGAQQASDKRKREEQRTLERTEIIDLFSPWLKPLYEYSSEPNGSFAKVTQRLKKEGTHEYKMILYDLATMINIIALPETEIGIEDVDLLRATAWLFGQPDEWTRIEFAEFIAERNPYSDNDDGFTLLHFLFTIDVEDFKRVVYIYDELALLIAGSEEAGRREGLSRVEDKLQSIVNEYAEKQKVSANCAMKSDTRYTVLKVEPGCSVQDLKIAYRREAALWHPDKLTHLAPELIQHAQQQMTVINEAYRSLSTEYGKNQETDLG